MFGDYLAVVNANIGGAKSDALITEHISLISALAPTGILTDSLTITRTFQNTGAHEWWYRVPNKDYIKILTPRDSALISLIGHDAPKISAPQKNISNAQNQDADLALIERNAQFLSRFNAWTSAEFGKLAIGAWLTTPPDTSRTLNLTYRRQLQRPRNGATYTFIYEKQSGVNETLDYTITAPAGFMWKESENEIFTYATQEPSAREIISLTLSRK